MTKPVTNRKARRTVADATVRVGPLLGLPALLRDLGCDPDEIFASVGLTIAEFKDPDNRISFVEGSNLLARCVNATGSAPVGLMLGKRVDPSSLGVAGFMLKSAPDVGSALRDLVRYLDLHDQGGALSLATVNRKAFLGYSILIDDVEAAGEIYDLSMAVACRVMRGFCGETWNPAEVVLSRRQPQDVSPYRRFFRAHVQFDAGQSALVFSRRWLKHPIATADPFLHRYLQKEASELRGQRDVSLRADLHRLLLKSMAIRECRVSGIAKQLGMHERTLNRRLQEEGTTFRQELQEIRFSIAKHLLAGTNMSLSKISEVLDYSDETAFSRAFKRWSASTPTEWRARCQQT